MHASEPSPVPARPVPSSRTAVADGTTDRASATDRLPADPPSDAYAARHADVTARLRGACADLSPAQFETVVRDICAMKLRWEAAERQAVQRLPGERSEEVPPRDERLGAGSRHPTVAAVQSTRPR